MDPRAQAKKMYEEAIKQRDSEERRHLIPMDANKAFKEAWRACPESEVALRAQIASDYARFLQKYKYQFSSTISLSELYNVASLSSDPSVQQEAKNYFASQLAESKRVETMLLQKKIPTEELATVPAALKELIRKEELTSDGIRYFIQQALNYMTPPLGPNSLAKATALLRGLEGESGTATIFCALERWRQSRDPRELDIIINILHTQTTTDHDKKLINQLVTILNNLEDTYDIKRAITNRIIENDNANIIIAKPNSVLLYWLQIKENYLLKTYLGTPTKNTTEYKMLANAAAAEDARKALRDAAPRTMLHPVGTMTHPRSSSSSSSNVSSSPRSSSSSSSSSSPRSSSSSSSSSSPRSSSSSSSPSYFSRSSSSQPTVHVARTERELPPPAPMLTRCILKRGVTIEKIQESYKSFFMVNETKNFTPASTITTGGILRLRFPDVTSKEQFISHIKSQGLVSVVSDPSPTPPTSESKRPLRH